MKYCFRPFFRPIFPTHFSEPFFRPCFRPFFRPFFRLFFRPFFRVFFRSFFRPLSLHVLSGCFSGHTTGRQYRCSRDWYKQHVVCCLLSWNQRLEKIIDCLDPHETKRRQKSCHRLFQPIHEHDFNNALNSKKMNLKILIFFPYKSLCKPILPIYTYVDE